MQNVTIRIPATPEYVRIARLVASGLASRLNFTIDEIEDLKIAVDELAAYLTGTQGREGFLEIVFGVNNDRIEIGGIARLSPGQKVRTELTDMSKMILDTVVDEASLAQLDGHPEFSLVKKKRA